MRIARWNGLSAMLEGPGGRPVFMPIREMRHLKLCPTTRLPLGENDFALREWAIRHYGLQGFIRADAPVEVAP
jgi:hypothetical protein